MVAREANEIAVRFPKVQRRVGGYNLDALTPGRNDLNLAHILVGSEGTLGFSTQIELKLSPLRFVVVRTNLDDVVAGGDPPFARRDAETAIIQPDFARDRGLDGQRGQ